ncbi:hypothetical protein UK12_19730 [Saccharothrix sp. ST-888]|nr:hypothetical protein UK12_19730 [Saccharothrix sp. ST-888]
MGGCCRVAAEDLTVTVLPRVGEHVVAGVTPLALAWHADGTGPTAPDDHRRLTRALRRAVRIGAERTLRQDTAFGLRQLVDIALRALSPRRPARPALSRLSPPPRRQVSRVAPARPAVRAGRRWPGPG